MVRAERRDCEMCSRGKGQLDMVLIYEKCAVSAIFSSD